MKRAKPVFRFVGGKPADGGQPNPEFVLAQFQAAQLLQDFFFLATEKGTPAAVREFGERLGAKDGDDPLDILRAYREGAGIEISAPQWFADLIR